VRKAARRSHCARRLGLPGTQARVLAEIQLEKIVTAIETEELAFCVIDSIQTVYSDQLNSAPGSLAQVHECAAQLTRVAKPNVGLMADTVSTPASGDWLLTLQCSP